MRAIELQKFGPNGLVLVDRPMPEPGPGEVRVKMRACSLNYRDWMTFAGTYNPRLPLPLVPLSDGVGIIDALGEGVTHRKVGERVIGLFNQAWQDGEATPEILKQTLGGPLDGMLREYAVLRADAVVPVPAHLSDVQAATLPCAALTAWSALVTQGHLKAGDTVLIQGTGGVSLFALQFCVLMGARAVVISSSDAKLQRAKAMGAWQTLNYVQTPDWGKAVLKLTGGVDHVVEVGGGQTFGQSLLAVRPHGHVAVIGVLSGAQPDATLLPILMKNLRVLGVMVGHAASLRAMLKAIDAAQLQPVAERVLPWTDAEAALTELATGGHFGKICLEF
jgi:NADPH:quinone reductase-like Zn-dependent oxidoreductase